MAPGKKSSDKKKAKASSLSAPILEKTNGEEEKLGSSPGPEEGSGNSSEDEDLGEESLGKVIELLGEDGLDEVGQMQLRMLGGEDDEEGDDASQPEDAEKNEDSADEDEDESDAEGAAEEDLDDDAVELDNLSDDDVSVDEDAVPRQKITVDNHEALARVRENFKLDSSLPWTETLVCNYPQAIEVEDVDDDLKRELEFYKQALHAAKESKQLASEARPPLPYTRPSDYFAEMVKSDSHMARIRQRLLDERADIKKSAEKRKEREHKKIGKQVQIEKLKERKERGKAEVEKVKGIKRKRQNMEDPADGFDIAVEDGGSPPPPSKRSKGPSGGTTRANRDHKFGFGGKVGRRAKQNTRESTEKIFGDRKPGRSGGGKGGSFKGGAKKAGGGAGKPKRLGKSKRMNAKR